MSLTQCYRRSWQQSRGEDASSRSGLDRRPDNATAAKGSSEEGSFSDSGDSTLREDSEEDSRAQQLGSTASAQSEAQLPALEGSQFVKPLATLYPKQPKPPCGACQGQWIHHRTSPCTVLYSVVNSTVSLFHLTTWQRVGDRAADFPFGISRVAHVQYIGLPAADVLSMALQTREWCRAQCATAEAGCSKADSRNGIL